MPTITRPHDTPFPSTSTLRRASLGRRVSASEALAFALAEMAFGPARRDDIAMLVATSAARIAAAGEMAR